MGKPNVKEEKSRDVMIPSSNSSSSSRNDQETIVNILNTLPAKKKQLKDILNVGGLSQLSKNILIIHKELVEKYEGRAFDQVHWKRYFSARISDPTSLGYALLKKNYMVYI